MATDPVERILRHAEQPLEPRAEFAGELLNRLLAQLDTKTVPEPAATEEKSMATVVTFPGTANGAAVPRPAWWREARQSGHRTRAWFLTHAATAALLLLTLVSGLIAFDAPRNLGLFVQSEPRATNELIARAEVMGIAPYTQNYTGIGRFTLDPGESLTSGPDSQYGDAVYLFLVETGTVALTVDWPAVLGTGEEDASTPLARDAEATLNAGDHGAIQPGTFAVWRNAGSETATVLNAAVGEAVDALIEFQLFDFARSHTIDWPAFPAVFALHRLTFDPGASLPVADLPGLMVLGVASGSIDVPLQVAEGSPARTRDFDAGEGLTTDIWKIAPGGELENSGTEPAVVYALLGKSVAAGAATPPSS